jgi:hypothetical protein
MLKRNVARGKKLKLCNVALKRSNVSAKKLKLHNVALQWMELAFLCLKQLERSVSHFGLYKITSNQVV